jgi:NAD(P)-dependent dehydrogenase (short-subunit alcohol dehydrogenase family)
MDNLAGRRVLITNVGIGPGPAIVAELTQRGARVAVQYAYDDKAANETATKISGLTEREPAIVQADLRAISECARAVEDAAEALGGLDVLVNNAGVVHPSDFLDTDEAVYDEVFDLNVRSYFFCAKRAVPFMLEAGGGSIVNVSCIHGHGGLPPRAANAAAEGAVIAITRELSMEWRDKGIRVNALAPGLIEEPRDFDIAGSTTEFGNTLLPAGKLGHPSYIALVVAFLASDDVDFTGQVL